MNELACLARRYVDWQARQGTSPVFGQGVSLQSGPHQIIMNLDVRETLRVWVGAEFAFILRKNQSPHRAYFRPDLVRLVLEILRPVMVLDALGNV